MFPCIRYLRRRVAGIVLFALLGLSFWVSASGTESPSIPAGEGAPTAAGLAEAREQLQTIEAALAGFDQRVKTASDGVQGNSQALTDLRDRLHRELERLHNISLRLNALGTRLQQNDEALQAQKSRLEDNAIKLYETLIEMDSVKKELASMRRAYEQMRATLAKPNPGVTAGDGGQDRRGLLLPLVLCLLVPLAVIVNQGGGQTTAAGATRETEQIVGILIAWFAGGIGFFLFGIGILDGPSLGGVIGNPVHFLGRLLSSTPVDLPPALLEQLVPNLLLASVVSVVACSSVPRGHLTNLGYSLVAVVVGALVYPLFGHWVALPGDLSTHSGWLAGPAFACSAATTQVALLGGVLALSLASGLGSGRDQSVKGSPPPMPTKVTAAGAMLLWVAWIGVILMKNAACLSLTALSLTLGAAAGGAALGVLLAEGASKPPTRWRGRFPFAVLAGVAAVPVGIQATTLVELAALGALTGVSASLLMRLFDSWSMTDIRLAAALSVGGIFGTLAPVLFGPMGLLRLHAIDFLAPEIKAMGVALLLGLVVGRALAWAIGSTRFLRTTA